MNIVCVLSVEKNKVVYSEEWVDKLCRAVNRNYSKPFNFYCLSNVQTKYDTIKLTSNSSSFWNKIELFKHFKEPTLYFDLDAVIINDFTDLVETFFNYDFLMIKEPYQNIANSSIMFWKTDHSKLYDEYIKNKNSIVEEYKRVPRYGDQAYIAERVEHVFINDIDAESVSWEHHKTGIDLKDNSKFLIFTSHQCKPYNSNLEIVKRNWI